MKKRKFIKRGFSLVELSIVLIIIGLLLGGVSVGSKLIKAAKISSIINDLTEYERALYSFELAYDALPGDMNNASSFWTSSQDGDGDSLIKTSCISGPNNLENLIAFEHLSSSKIISGDYSGLGYVSGSQSELPLAGYNVPELAIASAVISYSYLASWYIYNSGTLINFERNLISAGLAHTSCSSTNLNVFKPVDVKTIDSKIDDGYPDTGLLVSGTPLSACAEASTGPTTAEYNLDSTTELCPLFYLY
ncbi:MAG: prepilin-type N-terminal cleavage/methylation domain-containing protein [Alphaproteobacteria bacterium]|nr:prepilin-type N-terminal cleavage/methylation domain-containing protein [Alphaproteobacteria bacterium]